MYMLLGIDVGGTSVKYATCDEKGHLFDKGSFKTPDTLEDMYQAIETIYKERFKFKICYLQNDSWRKRRLFYYS